MMPLEWRNQFKRLNHQHLSTVTLPAFTEYMMMLSSLEDSPYKKHKGNGGGQPSNTPKQVCFDNNNQYLHRGHGNRGCGSRGSFSGCRCHGGCTSAGSHPQPDDHCPIYGTHPWKMCYLNPYGDNYHPSTGGWSSNPGCGRGYGSRNGSNNTNGQNQNHMFYNDHNGSRDPARHDLTWSHPQEGGGGRFAHTSNTGSQVGLTSLTQSWYAHGNDSLSCCCAEIHVYICA
jgi:hypothetical protein